MIEKSEHPEVSTTQTASVRAENRHVAEMKIRVEFGAASMAGRDVAGIEQGSVIELDSKVSDDVEVFVDGVLLARGQAVLVKAQACPQESCPTGSQPGDEKVGVAVREIIHSLDRQTLGRYQADSEKPVFAAGKKLAIIALVAALAAWPATSTAQTAPASAPAGDHNARPILPSPTDTKLVNGGGGGGESSWMPTLQTLLALAVVVAMIYACRYVLRRLGKNGGPSGAASGAIEVLWRTGIGARQQLLLVRLGRRLVLVGSWPGGMTGLSEITDPAEMSALTSLVEAGRSGGSARAVADKIRNRLDAKESK